MDVCGMGKCFRNTFVRALLLLLVLGMVSSSVTASSAGGSVMTTNGVEYELGDVIQYEMTVRNTNSVGSGIINTVDVYDEYPDGTAETLQTGLIQNPNDIATYNTQYTVTQADVDRGMVTNMLKITGVDSTGDSLFMGISKSSLITQIIIEPPAIYSVHNINQGTDYTTIQAAIDDASPGDEIHVDSGTYYENVIVNKQLILRGMDTGAGMPVVDAGGIGNAIILSMDGITLEGFMAINAGSGSSNFGINVISSNNTLSGNTASNNSGPGIRLISSSNNTLIGNTANNNGNGIELGYSSNNTLIGNTANNSGIGIEMSYSRNNTLMDNTASNNTFGIRLYYSSNNTLMGNTASNNSLGLRLTSSSNNTLIGNTASNNIFGIYLSYSSNTFGIYRSLNNILYHNNLVDNTNNAHDYDNNQWDSGTEGNYYSDYPSTDSDGDGIGNTPYPIPGGSSVDKYPLMASYSPPTSGYEGKLLRQTGDFKVYLIEDGKKRHITSPEALEWNGYSFDDVIEVSVDVMNSFEPGADISITQAIIDKYNALGGAAIFGPPAGTGEQTGYPDAAGVICTYVNFQNGAIEYFTNGDQAGNAYAILNPFFSKWASMGYGNSVLGYPISDMSDIQTSKFGTEFRYQHFKNGTELGSLEYNLATGDIYEIHGAIYATWSALGYADSELGAVTSDERDAVASFKGTTGRVSDFENGHLHWHSSGDHAGTTYMTYGDLDALYVSMGGSDSWLGFPVMHQEDRGGYGYCEFEGGYIEWDGSEYKALPITNSVHNINKSTDYTTIQAAIDDASPGDEIHVDSGTYDENVNVNKQLTLRGIDTGAGMPVVDAGGSGSAITLSTDGITFEEFMATNAGSYPNAGIKVMSGLNTLRGNIVLNNNGQGIYLLSSNNNIISENKISNNSDGIYLDYSSNNIIKGNTVSNNNGQGILLEPSSNSNAISDNNASYNGNHGIVLGSSNNNRLSGNTASNNNGQGILLESSSDSILNANTALNNVYYGIYLHSSSNNILYYNNLDNTNNAYDDSNNQWDSGAEGNYYSDYPGTDSGGDGIGDTPYPILSGSNVDRYPLMAPYSPTPPPATIQDKTLMQVEGQPEVYWFQNNKLYWVTDWDVINQMSGIPGWGSVNALPASEFDPAGYEQEPRFIDIGAISDGLLIREQNQLEVYLILDGEKHHIISDEVFLSLGYSFDDVIDVSAIIIGMFPTGSDIGTGFITITSPNGGEEWQAGTTQTTQWSYTGNPGSNVKIEFFKSGVIYQTITSSTPIGSGGSGSYSWTIPSTQTAGTNYQIRVTSTTNPAYTDISDGHFAISASSVVGSTYGGSDPNSQKSYDPINMGSGSYIYQRQDLSISGRGLPLTITRSYNSMDLYNGSFGSGWTFNYNVNLAVAGSGDILVMREDGRRDAYTLNPDGTYSPPLTVFDTLIKNPDDTYTLDKEDQIKYNFTSHGKLINIMDKNGNQISLTYMDNNLTKVTDASGRELIFVYDAMGRIISITDPMGRIWSYAYDAMGNLIQYSDPTGGQFSYTYDENHWMTSIIDPRGNQIMANIFDEEGRVVSQSNALGGTYTYSYNVVNQETTETDPFGGTIIYAFDEHFWGLSETDAMGNIISYAYDANGNRNSVTNANGPTVQFTYDDNGDITQISDPLGHTSLMTYDLKDNLISMADALARQTFLEYDVDSNLINLVNALSDNSIFTYDEYGQIISGTDANGNTANFVYDNNGNQIAVTDALGNTMAFTYDDAGRLIETTDANGNTYIFTYDDLDRLISATDPLGNTASNTYDAADNRISFTDASGSMMMYSYNALNQLVEVTDTMGGTVYYDYDIVGNMISMTDANGQTTNYEYDPLNRLISIIDPLGHVTTYSYDAIGNRISLTDPAGSLTSYSYDSLNQLVGVTAAMGATVYYDYDVVGNMISMTDANGHTTNYEYDPLNRPVSTIDPFGYATSNTYDAVGNLISLTDAAGSLTTYSYDSLNQLVEVTDAMSGTVQYSYDAVSNMISMADANGHTTNYAYDPLNRQTSIIDPLGHTASNIYDAVGNVVGLTDANGNSISYNYDALNRLAEIAYDDGQIVSYGYDATGNRLMVVDNHGTTNYQYDSLNRLINVINPDSQTVGYMYDAVSNRIQITYPDGKAMTYGYDANNRLTGATNWDGHITGYSYDANSNLIGMAYPNGMSTEYLYDENNQLIELINEDATQVVSSFEYTLDAVGNRQSVAEWFSDRFESESGIPQVLTTSYEYDDLYRLTQVNYPFEETVNYNYDPMGNRISMTTTIDETDKTINYAYDASDRLLQSDGTTYDYDNNGNMVRKTENPGRVTFYNYDGANRLISLSTLFGNQRDIYDFEYDGDGNRLSKTTINGKRTKSIEYLLDVNANLPRVLTESDDKGTTFYAHGLDLISMTDPRGKESYYHHDGLGSVRSLSDSQESIKAIYSYDAFGQTRKEMGHVDNDFRFTGEQMDDETGLIYLRARYYDPGTGRFINKDPFPGIGTMTQSLNRYVYTMNDPVNLIDPSGYSSEMVDSKKIKEDPSAIVIEVGEKKPMIQSILDDLRTFFILGESDRPPESRDLDLPMIYEGRINEYGNLEYQITAPDGVNEVYIVVNDNTGKSTALWWDPGPAPWKTNPILRYYLWGLPPLTARERWGQS